MKIYVIFISLIMFSFSYANEKVVLQLKWVHQFQFAGYYAAKEKGFYKEAGLDVEIKERDIRYDNIEQVIHGEAQYGIADSVLLLYTSKKEPIKIVTPVFQHSPGVVLTLKSSGLDNPYKLNNKKIAFYKKDTDGFALLAMLKSLNTRPKLERIRVANDYKLLQDKKVDAYVGYLTNEAFYFQDKGIDINIINPANYGFDFYGDMLFTNADEAKNHPLRVEKFKNATLKGWKYALENKEELIKLIKSKYTVNKSIEHLRYEANAIEQMIQNKSIPLGTLDKGRIEYTLNIYKKFGLIENNIPLNEYIFESFKSPLDLTSEERLYLQKKSSINMCIDPDWMPYEKNTNGEHIGMTADYFKLFQEQLNMPINLVNTKSWIESIEYGKQRKCDIFSLVMPTNTRKVYLDFTKPYIKIPLVIATTMQQLFINKITDVKNKKLGIVTGYAYAEILRQKYPTIQLIEIENITKGLKQVENGNLFGFIGTLATLSYQIQKNHVGQLKIAGKLDEEWEGGIGIRNDEPILKTIFNKAIDNITHKQNQDILNKWISVDYEQELDYTIIFKWLGVLLFLFTTILFVILKANVKLKEAKQKAEESDKAKSVFLANMSHEIRTPLNAILGFVSLLRKENEGRERSINYINIVESSSKTLLNTIEDILDFSKIESGKLSIDLIDFNLKEELEVITSLFDAKSSEKDLTLIITFEDNLPKVINSDPHRIKQIVSNLLSNAIKFTQAHKSIEINIGFEDKYLKISVRDEGKGIAKDKLALIFEPFSQEDNSTTREFGGTGLGLSISNELIRLLGGDKLKIKSELDVGSEFYFEIPVQIIDSISSPIKEIENIKFMGKKLLVVEDNKSNQLFMSILLDELEIDCDIANDGVEATKIFKLNKYDAILMDENMPNMSGIEATQYIINYEQENNLLHTPIIALTANAIQGDRERFLNAGMDEYMTKPLEKTTLIKMLSIFLK